MDELLALLERIKNDPLVVSMEYLHEDNYYKTKYAPQVDLLGDDLIDDHGVVARHKLNKLRSAGFVTFHNDSERMGWFGGGFITVPSKGLAAF